MNGMDEFLNKKNINTNELEAEEISIAANNSKGIVERINKKIIVEDGRQLLL